MTERPGEDLELSFGMPVEPDSGLRRHAVRQSSMTVSGQAALAGIQLISTLVLARLLVPFDFGLLAMVATLVAFVGLFGDFGLTQAVVQARHVSQRQATGLFWFSVAVAVVLSLGMALLAPVIAWLYGQPELISITLVFAVVVFVNSLGTTPRALLSRHMAFRWIVMGEVIAGITGMLVAFGVALAGGGYWALVAIPVTRAAIETPYLWMQLSWRPRRPQRSTGILPLLDFGAKLSASNVATFFNRHSDDVLIGWRWGPGALGQYAAAYRVLMLPLTQISAPVSRIALPALARLRDDAERYRAAYLRILRVLASVTSPLMGFAAVTSRWVIEVLLGPGWEEAAEILMWLAMAGIVQPLTNSTGWLFLSQRRLGEHLRWSVTSAVLAVASFVIGLPFGAVGVAAAYAVSGILIRFPLLLWWTGRRGPVSTPDLIRVFGLPLALTLLVMSASLTVQFLLSQVAPIVGVAMAASLAAAGASIVLVSSIGRELRTDARVILQDLRRHERLDP